MSQQLCWVYTWKNRLKLAAKSIQCWMEASNTPIVAGQQLVPVSGIYWLPAPWSMSGVERSNKHLDERKRDCQLAPFLRVITVRHPCLMPRKHLRYEDSVWSRRHPNFRNCSIRVKPRSCPHESWLDLKGSCCSKDISRHLDHVIPLTPTVARGTRRANSPLVHIRFTVRRSRRCRAKQIRTNRFRRELQVKGVQL